MLCSVTHFECWIHKVGSIRLPRNFLFSKSTWPNISQVLHTFILFCNYLFLWGGGGAGLKECVVFVYSHITAVFRGCAVCYMFVVGPAAVLEEVINVHSLLDKCRGYIWPEVVHMLFSHDQVKYIGLIVVLDGVYLICFKHTHNGIAPLTYCTIAISSNSYCYFYRPPIFQ
jgi:hypothetical protein